MKDPDARAEIVARFYDEIAKENKGWDEATIARVAYQRLLDMEKALIMNIASEDVYLNHHKDAHPLDTEYWFKRKAMDQTMEAFGVHRYTKEELIGMGIDPESFNTASGMQAWLYRHGDGPIVDYILAYRGTESGGDG